MRLGARSAESLPRLAAGLRSRTGGRCSSPATRPSTVAVPGVRSAVPEAVPRGAGLVRGEDDIWERWTPITAEEGRELEKLFWSEPETDGADLAPPG